MHLKCIESMFIVFYQLKILMFSDCVGLSAKRKKPEIETDWRFEGISKI